jgi:hypothetical protein
MSSSDLISRPPFASFATATVATLATHEGKTGQLSQLSQVSQNQTRCKGVPLPLLEVAQ